MIGRAQFGKHPGEEQLSGTDQFSDSRGVEPVVRDTGPEASQRLDHGPVRQ